jgi:uncharacterized protein YdaU (DUF1376 family)
MSKEPSPAFQWYPSDIQSDGRYRALPSVARGPYRDLLDFVWMEGELPNNDEVLAALVNLPVAEWQTHSKRILELFQVNPKTGMIRHRRLDAERKKQAAYRAARQHAGRSGAEKRWSKSIETKADDSIANAEAMAKNSFSSSSSSSSSEKKDGGEKGGLGGREDFELTNPRLSVKIADPDGMVGLVARTIFEPPDGPPDFPEDPEGSPLGDIEHWPEDFPTDEPLPTEEPWEDFSGPGPEPAADPFPPDPVHGPQRSAHILDVDARRTLMRRYEAADPSGVYTAREIEATRTVLGRLFDGKADRWVVERLKELSRYDVGQVVCAARDFLERDKFRRPGNKAKLFRMCVEGDDGGYQRARADLEIAEDEAKASRYIRPQIPVDAPFEHLKPGEAREIMAKVAADNPSVAKLIAKGDRA